MARFIVELDTPYAHYYRHVIEFFLVHVQEHDEAIVEILEGDADGRSPASEEVDQVPG